MGATRATVLWLGMIVAGVGLGAVAFAAWPEPAVRVVRLPYGEVQPKTPTVAAATERRGTVTASSAARPREPAVVVPEAEAEAGARVLAAVEPAPSSGPEPVPSELELDPDYVQESPEELGAEPLPGADLTSPPVTR